MLPLRTVAPETINILLADCNQTQRQLLAGALRRRSDFRVTSCDFKTDTVLEAIAAPPVHVVVLNPSHSQDLGDELVLVRRLHLAHPEVATVVLLDTYDREVVIKAFRSGVRGIFCFSEHPFRLLCRCIQSVHEGQVWANSEQLQFLIDVVTDVPSLRMVNANGAKLLTAREEQVVALVTDGLGNREIAHELGLSEHTVKKYLFRIFDKLGLSSRVELALYAVHHSQPRQAEWLAGAGA